MFLLLALVICLGVANGNNWSNELSKCDRNDDKELSNSEFMCLFMHMDSNADGEVSNAELIAGWKHDGLDYKDHVPMFFLEMDFDGDYRITNNDLDYLFGLWDINFNNRVSEHELEDGWNSFFYDKIHKESD